MRWLPIALAPQGPLDKFGFGPHILLYAPGRDGLPPIILVGAFHPDAGFCIDEIRDPTHWMLLPAPPKRKGP